MAPHSSTLAWENPMDGGAWKAAVPGVGKSRTGPTDFTFTFMHWRRKWQPTPVFLPGESQGRGAWWAAVHWVAQSRTRLKRLSSSSNPRWCRAKESNAGDRSAFDPWVRKIPWSRKWQTTPIVLPGKFHGQRSLLGYSPWVRKELDMTEQLHFTFKNQCLCSDP